MGDALNKAALLALPNEQVEALLDMASRCEAAEAALAFSLKRESGMRLEREADKARVKRRIIGYISRVAAEAERRNRADQSERGDTVAAAFAFLLGELNALDPKTDPE